MINKLFFCFALSDLSGSSMPMDSDSVKLACKMSEHIIETSEAIEISPFILAALIWNESRWDPNVVSYVGACGLTQVLPKYSPYSCKDLKSPKVSITEGASILYELYQKKGNVKKALECYNSGNVCKAPKYASTIIDKAYSLKKKYFKLQSHYMEN